MGLVRFVPGRSWQTKGSRSRSEAEARCATSCTRQRCRNFFFWGEKSETSAPYRVEDLGTFRQVSDSWASAGMGVGLRVQVSGFRLQGLGTFRQASDNWASAGMGGAPWRVTIRITAKSLLSEEKGISPVYIKLSFTYEVIIYTGQQLT